MKQNAMTALRYLWSKCDRAVDGVTRELSENRAILNWVYAVAYLALIFYCAVTNKDSHTTAIMTTGTIVSAIFSAYVLATSYEKVTMMKMSPPPPKPAADTETPESEDGASA